MSIELNESNFHETIANYSGLVLVDFFTTWCGPCRMLAPIIEQLKGVQVVKVDGDQSQSLVIEQGVMAYPTIILYRNGTEVRRVVGLKSLEDLQDIVDEHNGG